MSYKINTLLPIYVTISVYTLVHLQCKLQWQILCFTQLGKLQLSINYPVCGYRQLMLLYGGWHSSTYTVWNWNRTVSQRYLIWSAICVKLNGQWYIPVTGKKFLYTYNMYIYVLHNSLPTLSNTIAFMEQYDEKLTVPMWTTCTQGG